MAFGAICNVLSNVANAKELPEPPTIDGRVLWSKELFNKMNGQHASTWDRMLGSFKPIHPKPMEGRSWTWVATIRADADDESTFRLPNAYHISHRRKKSPLQQKGKAHRAKARENFGGG